MGKILILFFSTLANNSYSNLEPWCSINSAYVNTFLMSIKQYIPRNMHTVFALLCFVVVIYWLIFPYPSGLLHWHCGNLTIAPVPAKQPWWIWINTSYEFIMNDCITTTKQSTTKPCAYFLGYTVSVASKMWSYFLSVHICNLKYRAYLYISLGFPNVSVETLKNIVKNL